MATLGDTNIEGTPGLGLSAGNIWLFKYTLAAPGTFTDMQLYCNDPGGAEKANLCIYSDSGGSPNALLAQTGDFILTTGAQWHLQALITPYVAAAGDYWLGVLAPTGFGGIDNIAYLASAGTSWFAGGVGATPPNPIASGGVGTDLISLFADYTPGGAATQIVAPVVDVSRGTWLAEPGDGTTNLWDQINETVLSATDYIQSSQSPVAADIYKVRIAPLQAPVKPRSNGAFHFRVDALKDVTGGDSMQLTVKLYAADGTTLIKAWTPIAVDVETTTDLTLTGAEADTIPDADFAVGLVLAFEALKV